jgi:chromosome segregation ATPase
MKNSTILKDELGLLNSDRSAVITELRKLSEDVKNTHILKSELETQVAEVKDSIQLEMTRLDDVRSRVFSYNAELAVVKQDLSNERARYESARVKNAQEYKLHLGRIKELADKETKIKEAISELKDVFDKNSKAYSAGISEKTAALRQIESKLETVTKELALKEKELKSHEEEEKKLTKERLKREDKIRNREKILDAREISLAKKEEDLMTMAKDMTVIYGRIKEVYSRTHPDVDLDKLILNAI